MGKFAFSVVGMLLLLGAPTNSAASTKLQTRLPSEVKKTKSFVAKALKGKKGKLAKKARGKETSQSAATLRAMAEVRDSGLSQFNDKFISSTAHFAASTGPLTEEYDCDASAEEQQLRQAEREAMNKCEARGEEHCRLHQIKIVKKGELRCQDIPGRDCSQKKFYRGCVAQAIVVADDEPEAQASIF